MEKVEEKPSFEDISLVSVDSTSGFFYKEKA